MAELASAFLCAEFGINKEVRHASYIANWIELLRADATGRSSQRPRKRKKLPITYAVSP